MGTLCIRPTDCLAGAGQAFFTARRGVRAAPAPAPRQPMQQRGRQAPAAASPASAAVQPRLERGEHSRRLPSPAAEARSLPHKRAMENVVILKRGDPIPAALMVAAPAAELSAARGVDQRGRPDADEEKAEASGRQGAGAGKAEAAPAAQRTVVPLAKEAAAKQLAPPAGYSGHSFAMVAPEPRALPIPVHFLKPRGREHDGRALAPAAAAA